MRNGRRQKIAILTGGGDCPGINAVIRAVTKKAILEHDMQVIGVQDGYDGLVADSHRVLTYDDVSGIITLGGTILGASKSANPYKYPVKVRGGIELRDVSRTAVRTVKRLGVSCLVCVGGDGTLGIAHRLFKDGVPVVGVPKTIDNDVRGTDITFGFDSAVSIATDGVDRIHTTAQSHHRIMIVEVMGHRAGWIALHSGIAGGGDVILVPEIPYDTEKIARWVKRRLSLGRRFTIVVAAEGARPRGGTEVIRKVVETSADPLRLGGVSFVLAEELESLTGLEARAVLMGHLQRGGPPTPFDRVLASQLGSAAVDLIAGRKFGRMVAVRAGEVTSAPLSVAAGGPRVIPRHHRLLETARSTGAYFGD
ncbi:MAG: ATP-dependent 6-phosphofructokinase [Candidatus Eisenbacteria bacterium]|nr:ATP-dependent 6-phosphofructokinase [Candidatus Eisenbacteria bacterium]